MRQSDISLEEFLENLNNPKEIDLNKDLTGESFAGSRVEKRLDNESWDVICCCGKNFVVNTKELQLGLKTNCGCFADHLSEANKELRIQSILDSIKEWASYNNRFFSLTAEQALIQWIRQDGICPISGVKLSLFDLGDWVGYLDIKDEERGYVSDNIRWIHPMLGRLFDNLGISRERILGILVAASNYKPQIKSFNKIECGKLIQEIDEKVWVRLFNQLNLQKIPVNFDREFLVGLYLANNRRCWVTGEEIEIGKTARLQKIDEWSGWYTWNVMWVHNECSAITSFFEPLWFKLLTKQVAETRKNPPAETKIVMVSGGFDPPHIGHYSLFREASKYGKVVVALNSDAWLQNKKGYAVSNWSARKAVLEEACSIAMVVSVDDSDGTVCEAIQRIKPDFFANGGDRKQDNVPEVALSNVLRVQMIWEVGGGDKLDSSSQMVKRVVETELAKQPK